MSHPLTSKLQQLAGRWNRHVLQSTVAQMASVVLGVVMAAGLMDYALRLRDVGLRGMLSVAVVAAIVASVVWAWRTIASRRSTAFGIARMAESAFPQLGDRIASALTFLNQDENDSRAGSAELRRRVITEAAATSETIPLAEALVLPGERRAWQSFAGACLCLVAISVFAPSLVGTAIARLAMPWAGPAWPRADHLEFKELPSLVARGEDFEAEVVSTTSDMPADTRLEYRYRSDGRRVVDRLPPARVGDRVFARRLNVQRSFEVRVTGGDDYAMRWNRVQVVDPPQLAEGFARVTPPAYSGINPTRADTALRILAGSEIEWMGKAGETLASASIEFIEGDPLTLKVAGDARQQITGTWKAEDTNGRSAYRVTLTNPAGLVGTTSPLAYEVVADRPPLIRWGDSAMAPEITTRAMVPLNLQQADDLAIHFVSAGVKVLDAEGAAKSLEQMPLLDAGESPPSRKSVPLSMPDAERFAAKVDLLELQLEAGQKVEIIATAEDYAGQQSATDRAIKLLVVTDQEFAGLLAANQQILLDALLRALEAQRTAREQTTQLVNELSLAEVGRESVDTLVATTVSQRQVSSLLGDERIGALAQARAMRDRIANNRFDAATIDEQLATVVEVLARLLKQPLPGIESQLGVARGSLEQALANDSSDLRKQTVATLRSTADPQKEVILALEQLLDKLQQWGDAEQYLRELALLEQAQRALAARSTELATRQMKAAAEGRNDSELDEAAKQIAEEQQELGRRFRRVEQGLRDLAESQKLSEELRQQIEDAIDEATDRKIARNMSDASDSLKDKRFSQASQTQAKTADDLAALLEQLRNRTPSDPAALADALRKAAKQLGELRDQNQQNSKQPEGAQKRQRRDELARQMQRLSRKLSRLSAQAAGESTQSAGNKLQQPNEPSPEEQADDDLRKAQEQLENRIAQLEQEQEQKELERLAAELRKLIPRQREVIETTLGHENRMPADVAPDEKLKEELDSTSALQSLLASELRVAIDNVSARQVFQMALQGAADDMQRAAERLANHDPGRTTQAAQLAALTRMQNVADVLTSEPPQDENEDEDDGGGGGGGGGGQQPPPPLIDLAEVKMLRWLQVELNGRTRLNEAGLAAAEEATPDQTKYTQRLAAEQQRLAELVREMMSRRAPPENGGPDI